MLAREQHRHADGDNDDPDHAREHGHGRAYANDAAPPVAAGFTPREARQARRLLLVLALVFSFFVVELAGALLAGSVVLQADALHLFMDVLALGVNVAAMRVAVRRPTGRFTFGLRRVEPAAAVFSGVLVLVTTGLIVAEGVEALREHAAPRPGIMLAFAVMALLVNGASAWLLHDVIENAHGHPHGHALNLRGAWLHLLGDTLGALAAIVAALFIRYGGRPSADAIASFVVAATLVFGSLRLLRDATLVLLESAPKHLPVAMVREIVSAYAEVASVRELHVWTLGAGHDAITVHVMTSSSDPRFGHRLAKHLRSKLDAEYVTVQVDAPDLAVLDKDAAT
jgi:cobalt-zinc-cadmium efflux system protein